MELCVERLVESAYSFEGDEKITQAHGAVEKVEHALIEALINVEALLEDNGGLADPARHYGMIAQAKANGYLAIANLYSAISSHLS